MRRLTLLAAAVRVAAVSVLTPAASNGVVRPCDERFDRLVPLAAHAMSAAGAGLQFPHGRIGIARRLASGSPPDVGSLVAAVRVLDRKT